MLSDTAPVWRLWPALGLFAAVAACGSEPLHGGQDGRSGASGAMDPRGEGGASAGGPATRPVPDFTTSGCYGRPATTTVYDAELHVPVPQSATCRAEGERTYVYVADSLFGNTVTQADINEFLYRFETAGAAQSFRPELGVLLANELVFGELTSAQLPASKLLVFVVDSPGQGNDGYLCDWCDQPELHLDALELLPLPGDEALSVAAHESFHIIHRGYDPDELLWVDETLAEAAMTVNGFVTDEAWLDQYLADPNQNWGPGLTDVRGFHYGAGLAFGTYLWEQGGPELMRRVTQEPKNGWSGLDAALAASGSDRDGLAMFHDMSVALLVDDPARGYGFETLSTGDQLRKQPLDVGHAAGTLQPFGLTYRSVAQGLRALTIEGDDGVHARLVVSSPELEVRDVPLGREHALSGFPTTLIVAATAEARYAITAR